MGESRSQCGGGKWKPIQTRASTIWFWMSATVSKKQFGGVPVDVQAICRSTRNSTSKGVQVARAVLLVERGATTPGSWLPDQAVLTPLGLDFLAHLHARMVDRRGIRCDGYTAAWPPSPVDAQTLSLARARIACDDVRRGTTLHPKLVAHGLADPIASNGTEDGRAANRRVTITVVHLLAKRTSGGL